MFICICNGITEKDIETAAEQGVYSIKQLRERFDVADQCGRCTQFVKSTLAIASERYDLALEIA